MKIIYITTTVHISTDLGEALGSTTRTFSEAKELAKLGHEVIIVSEKFPGDSDRENIKGIKIIRLNRAVVASSKNIKKSKLRVLLRPARIIPNYILARQIAEIIRQEKGDIVLERSHSRGVGAMAAEISGKPLVEHIIDHIYSPYSIRKARALLANTDAVIKPKYRDKVTLVSCGYDPENFHPVRQEKKYDACYVGSFKEWDGLEDLLTVARQLPYRKFLLIGDGVRRELIGKNKPANIILAGKVPISEIKNYLCSAKIGVAPFNTKLSEKGEFKKYGFYFSPLKIFEYLACGLPVVATDFSLIKEVIRPEYGILFPEGDIFGLKQAIEKLADNYSDYDTPAYAQKYSWAEVAKIMDAVLRQAL